MEDLLEIIQEEICRDHRRKPFRLEVTFGPVTNKKKKETMISQTITSIQKITATLHPEAGTTPEPIVGVPTWAVLPGGTGTPSTVVPATDGMSADLVSSDTDSVTTFQVSAFAGPGPTDDPITDTIVLTVVHPLADNLGTTLAAPVPK